MIDRPIFILGLNKSGTSVLYVCLSQHSKLSPIRAFKPSKPHRKGRGRISMIDYGIGEGQKIPCLPAKMATPQADSAGRWALPEQFDRYRLTEQDVSDDDRNGISQAYRAAMVDPQLRLVEKTPANLLRSRYLQALFPDATFIAIVRDPYANISANGKKRDFWGPVEKQVRHYVEGNTTLLTDSEHLQRFTLIKYEDLVSDPIGTLKQVCRFCDLDFEPAMVRGMKFQPELNDQLVALLTRQETDAITQHCASTMEALGYRPRAKPTMAKKKKKIGMGGAIQRYFVLGTDARRDFWAGLKRLRVKQLGQRERLAAQSSTNGGQSIAHDKGYRVFDPGTFPEVDDVIQEVHASIDEDLAAQTKNAKGQLATGLLDRKRLTRDTPIVRFALSPQVIAAVSEYLGVVPTLAGLDIWRSVYDGDEIKNSQFYHCDWADRTQVKIFIHCSKVEPENGPLVVLDAADSERARRALHYRYGSPQGRIDDGRMYGIVPESNKRVLIGPAGSVAMVDTSRCFHYGSRLTPDAPPRIVAMAQYLTPLAFTSSRKQIDRAPFRNLARDDDPEVIHLVLGAT